MTEVFVEQHLASPGFAKYILWSVLGLNLNIALWNMFFIMFCIKIVNWFDFSATSKTLVTKDEIQGNSWNTLKEKPNLTFGVKSTLKHLVIQFVLKKIVLFLYHSKKCEKLSIIQYFKKTLSARTARIDCQNFTFKYNLKDNFCLKPFHHFLYNLFFIYFLSHCKVNKFK